MISVLSCCVLHRLFMRCYAVVPHCLSGLKLLFRFLQIAPFHSYSSKMLLETTDTVGRVYPSLVLPSSGRLVWSLNLLGLALYLPSASVSLMFMVLYI